VKNEPLFASLFGFRPVTHHQHHPRKSPPFEMLFPFSTTFQQVWSL